MGPAADRWRAAAEDPSMLWRRIERLKFVSKRRAERIKAERARHQKQIEALTSDLQHVTNEFAESLRREQDAWAENSKLKTELAARDNKPVDSSEAIRARLLQPFLGSEAERLGATKYQLRGGEMWECKGQFESESEWEKILHGDPFWFEDNQYRLRDGRIA